MLMPVSTPIVYTRQDTFTAGDLGQIPPDHPEHARYRALLEETITDGYAKVVER